MQKQFYGKSDEKRAEKFFERERRQKHGEKACKRGVAIAYDSRHFSPEFAQQAACILAANGINVKLYDELRPTPELSFAIRYYGTIAGINITASHNPKEYLGIKYIPSYGGPATKEMTDEIVSLIDNCNEEGTDRENGEIVLKDFSEEYYNHIEKLIDFDVIKKAAPKFIYDGLYSASTGYFDTIFKKERDKF